MSGNDQPPVENPTKTEEDDIATFLTESLGLSILTGVGVIPLILPSGEGSAKFLLSKFQLQGADSQIVYEGLIPLDILTFLSLNFLKACRNAFRNVGEVRNENLMFVQIGDLRKALTDASSDIDYLLETLQKEAEVQD